MLETAGKSLHHSCWSELTRQGVSLPLDRYSYGRRLLKLRPDALNIWFLLISTGQVSDSIRHLTILQSPVFLINSRFPPLCYTWLWFPIIGHVSSEVTHAVCRVPSTQLSHTPWYTLPNHLCRSSVRTTSTSCFLLILTCHVNPFRQDMVRIKSLVEGSRILTWLPSAMHLCFTLGIGWPCLDRLQTGNLDHSVWKGSFFQLSLLMSTFSLPIPPTTLTGCLPWLTECSATALLDWQRPWLRYWT